MLLAADFRRIAREALNGKWALAVGTGFVALLLGGISMSSGSGGSSRTDNSNLVMNNEIGRIFIPIFIGIASIILVWVLVTLIIGGTIELGYCRFNKNLVKGTNPQFNDLFSRFDIFGKALAMRLLMIIYTLLWALLFIIPGIIAALSYAMTPYILEENNMMGANEAIASSKEMMRGNKWRLFCLDLSFIGWALLSALTCGIGMLWLIPYVSAANAAFYLEVSGQMKNTDVNI